MTPPGGASPALNGSLPPSAGVIPPAPVAEEDARRAASPTGSQRKVSNNGIGLGQPNSFGQVIGGGQQQQQVNGRPPVAQSPAAQQSSKIAKRATTGAIGAAGVGGPGAGAPARPARPDEELNNRRTMDPSSAPRYEDRAMSPTGGIGTGQQPRSSSASRNVSGGLASPTGPLGGSKGNTPPMGSSGTFAGQQAAGAMLSKSAVSDESPAFAQQQQQQAPSSEGGDHHPDPLASSTTLAAGNPNVNGASPPQDAFYYGARGNASPSVDHTAALKAKEDEIEQLKAREGWFKTALAQATRRGFVAPEQAEKKKEEGGEAGEEEVKPFAKLQASAGEDGPNREVLEALLTLKQELAKAKVSRAWSKQLLG